MKYTRLGQSALNVSRVCMGCMGFGDAGQGQHAWTLDEEHSREIIRHGLEMGINFFDTAIAYQSGTSEQYVGRALRDFAKREEVVVATKFLPRTQEEIENGVSGQMHIERMINKSLQACAVRVPHLRVFRNGRKDRRLRENESLSSKTPGGPVPLVLPFFSGQADSAWGHPARSGIPTDADRARTLPGHCGSGNPGKHRFHANHSKGSPVRKVALFSSLESERSPSFIFAASGKFPLQALLFNLYPVCGKLSPLLFVLYTGAQMNGRNHSFQSVS